MAEKLLQTSSAEEISCTLHTDSVFSVEESEYLLLASDSSAKKSSKKASSTKAKSSFHLRPNLRKNRLINVWTPWRKKWKNNTVLFSS